MLKFLIIMTIFAASLISDAIVSACSNEYEYDGDNETVPISTSVSNHSKGYLKFTRNWFKSHLYLWDEPETVFITRHKVWQVKSTTGISTNDCDYPFNFGGALETQISNLYSFIIIDNTTSRIKASMTDDGRVSYKIFFKNSIYTSIHPQIVIDQIRPQADQQAISEYRAYPHLTRKWYADNKSLFKFIKKQWRERPHPCCSGRLINKFDIIVNDQKWLLNPYSLYLTLHDNFKYVKTCFEDPKTVLSVSTKLYNNKLFCNYIYTHPKFINDKYGQFAVLLQVFQP